jgi:outer membrane protein OmpA-like peptidoglycan-associated protein
LTYGTYKIRDKISPGWSVELYQNGSLIKQMVTDAEGYYEFEIPVNYGASNYELKFYGKNGEFYSNRNLIQIPYEFLKPGEIKYSINAGVNPYYNTKIENAKLSLGLTNWLTNTFDYTHDYLYKKEFFRDELSMKLSNNLYFTYDYFHNELSKFILNYWAINGGSLRIINIWNTKPNQFYISNIKTETEIFASLPQFIPGISLSVQDMIQNYGDNFNSNFYSNLYLTFFPFQMNLNYNMNYSADKNFKNPNLINSILGSAGLFFIKSNPNAFIGSSKISFESYYDITNKNFAYFGLLLNQVFSRDLLLVLTPRYSPLGKNFSFELNLRVDFSLFRSTTDAFKSKQNYSASQELDGIIAFDSDLWSLDVANPTYSANFGNSAAAFRIFIDSNGNGKYDKGEFLVPDVSISMYNASIDYRSKSAIRYAYNLIPYARYNVTINPKSIKNPNWVLKYTDFSFIADPNVIKPIDIPVYVTGIIEGDVYRVVGGKKTGQAGVKVHIMRTDGTYHETQPVFSDGSFYKAGLMPGDYKAWVDSLQCAILDVVQKDTVKYFSIKSSRNGDIVEDLNFELFGKNAYETAEPAKPPNAPEHEKQVSGIGNRGTGIGKEKKDTVEKKQVPVIEKEKKDFFRQEFGKEKKDSVPKQELGNKVQKPQELGNKVVKKQDTSLVPKHQLGNEKGKEKAIPLQQFKPGDNNYVLYFSGDKGTTLTFNQQRQLDKIITYMKSHTDCRLQVDGHSDNFGTMEENMRISKLRADEVVTYLIRKTIPKSRLLWTGHGALFPVADNSTEAGRAKNRRVEIKLITN